MSADSRLLVRQIAAVAVGNALEWYDFGIYGYVAVTISKLFFPPETGWAPLLATFGLFAVAYIVRPIGGVILGYYADRFGRKSLLVLLIGVMATASAMIAAAPTYQTAGLTAPLVILVARLLQGLSAGGEFASATVFLVEHAPPQRRGVYGAWQFAGQGMAILLSGVIGLLVTRGLTVAQLETWGWRLPFALGAVVGPFGLYIRLKASETPAFLADQLSRRERQASVSSVLANHSGDVLIGLGLVIGGTAAFYVLFVFLPTYAIKVLKMGLDASFSAPVIAGTVVTVCCPVMGWLSDRFGRWRLMGVASVGLFVSVYPVFTLLHATPNIAAVAMAEMAFGILFAAYAGPFSATITELFPVRARATAIAIAYNVGVALFGGGAPLVVAWLIARTGNPLAPALYVMGALCLSLIAVGAMVSRTASRLTTHASFRQRQD